MGTGRRDEIKLMTSSSSYIHTYIYMITHNSQQPSKFQLNNYIIPCHKTQIKPQQQNIKIPKSIGLR